MFISRVEVDWVKARNPYELHRAVWTLFPGQEKEPRKKLDEPREGFLFRVEESHPGHPARLLVQSQISPQTDGKWARLLGNKEFDPKPSTGQQLEFLLTANPIKTITDTAPESKPNKKTNKRGAYKCRAPLIREEEQTDWLRNRLENCAVIESIAIQAHPPLFFYGKGNNGKLLAVTFQGVLKVTNPETLRQRLQNGIGPAKAFGCGLLLVRRA
jgi:CRISPR system Cascade subunit CasE